jgi:tetratricopeptide (TPR) repeat protein
MPGTPSESTPAPDPCPVPPACARDAPSQPGFNRTVLLTCVLLVGATLLAFGRVTGNDFVNYDDPDHVTENPYVRAGLSPAGVRWAFTTTHAVNPCWQPLAWLSLMLDTTLQGTEPSGYHRTSLLLHVANTLLLFLFLRRATGRVGPSGVVAAFFALHPLHVESVAWAAERKDVLSTLFGLLALWAYVGYAARPGLGRYVLVLVAFALGLLAKPMLVTLPCVLLLLDYWPLGRWRPAGTPAPDTSAAAVVPAPLGWLLAEKVPLFVLAAGASVMTLLAQQGVVAPAEHVPLPARLANAVTAYVTYLRQTFWPAGLAVFYPYFPDKVSPGSVAAGTVLLGALSATFLGAARRWPYLAVGWLWFLGTLVPVIGLVQVGTHAHADRYTYVPLIGLFLLLTWSGADLLAHWRVSETFTVAIVGLLLGACLSCTWRQVGTWHDSVTLWRHALDVTADNYLAHDNLGVFLWKRGERTEALAHYTEAVRINPAFASAHYNLSVALAARGQADQAIEHVREAVRLNPRHAPAQHNLGMALWTRGRLDEAADHCTAALAVNPAYASAWHVLGAARWQQGRNDEAIACYRRAVELGPDVPRYLCSLAFALSEAGRREEAEAHYRRALQLDPNWPRAFCQAAWQLATHPDPRRRGGAMALLLARQVCQAPGGRRPAALDALAAALAENGRFEEAARTAEEAAALARAEGQASLVAGLEQRRRLYQSGQPYRQEPATGPPGTVP